MRENIKNLVAVAPDTATQVIARNMMNGKKGFYSENNEELGYTCSFDGQESYVFYAPIERIGWSMALVVPKMTIDIVGYVVGGLLGFLVLMAILTVLFVTPYFIRRNLKPLKMLADSASEVAKGNFQQPLPVLKHKDEISMLRDSFEGMQQSLDDYIKELKSTTASKAAIENELKVAHDIQMSMLPKNFPPYPERNDIDIFGSLKPAKDVGGTSPWLIVCLILTILIAATLIIYLFNDKKKHHAVSSETEQPEIGTARQNADKALMERICRLMEEGRLYQNCDLKVTDIATALGTNRRFISDCINSQKGCTFNQFINTYRVEHAKRLMRQNPDKKIADVYMEAGFANEQSFFRTFKAITGQTPKEWRQF